MKDLFTPKQVAQAIDVSESSVKRWCDKGLIEARYTAGGHRRIVLPALLSFLKANGHAIARPELLGLPAPSGTTDWVLERAAAAMTESLLAGDEERSRRIMLDLHLAEHSAAAICDEVFAVAFHEIGDRWECGSAEVYQERLSCQIAVRVLNELRSYLPSPPPGAPIALGGSPEQDQYQLASTMAEMVLRDAGWNAVSLGANLPFKTLAAAIERHRPRIFWLSCSHLSDVEGFVEGMRELYDEFEGKLAFVVGGRALDEEVRGRVRYSTYCENMQRLASFAMSLTPETGNSPAVR